MRMARKERSRMTAGTILMQTAMAVLVTLAFATIYRVKFKHLPTVAAGGGISWLLYCLSFLFFSSSFFSNFCAALFSSAYAEAAARIRRAPTVVFLLPCLIPLVPGSGLYYTLSYAILRNSVQFNHYLSITIEATFGIAAGVVMIPVIMNCLARPDCEK